MCASGQTVIEEVFHDDERGQMAFVWYIEEIPQIDDPTDYWDGIPERYENFYPTFRIERAVDDYERGKSELDYELVDTVVNDFIWEGKGGTGEWIYRIALVEIASDSDRFPCPAPLLWDESVQHISLPITEAEWEEQAPVICAGVEIVELDGSGFWDDAELYWAIDVEALDYDNERYFEFFLDFALEYQPKSSEDWKADQLVGYSDHWATDYVFNGPAYPGITTYRVAVSGVTGYGADDVYSFPCQGQLRWVEIEVSTPNLEERAALEAERGILIAEASRCARDAFTSNISAEALPVIEKYIDGLILEMVPTLVEQGWYGDNSELASSTILICSLSSRQGGGDMGFWAMMFLFEGF